MLHLVLWRFARSRKFGCRSAAVQVGPGAIPCSGSRRKTDATGRELTVTQSPVASRKQTQYCLLLSWAEEFDIA